jgi:hypothetical protein
MVRAYGPDVPHPTGSNRDGYIGQCKVSTSGGGRKASEAGLGTRGARVGARFVRCRQRVLNPVAESVP